MLYILVHYLTGIILGIFFGLKAYRTERIPKTGPLILASNHASYLDPPVGCANIKNRPVHFIARSTLFKNKLFGWFISHLNAHPIERGGGPQQNWDFYNDLLNKKDAAVLIFPEGTRTEDGSLQRGKSGFGKIVHMSKAAVHPVYIDGSFQAWPKGGKMKLKPIKVIYGNPVDLQDLLDQPGDKKVLRSISNRVMDAIGELKKELEQVSK